MNPRQSESKKGLEIVITKPFLILLCFQLFLRAVAVAAAEFINATSSIDKFLLTCEEWVRSTCNF